MAQELKKALPPAPRAASGGAVAERVREIVADVRARGDAAVREYSARFDGWEPGSFRLDADRVAELVASLPTRVVDDIRFVQDQVRGFALVQREALREVEVETLPGVVLGHKHVPTCWWRPCAPCAREPGRCSKATFPQRDCGKVALLQSGGRARTAAHGEQPIPGGTTSVTP